MGFSLLDEWSRRNNPDYWLMRHGELLGKVVKTENKDGGFVATVKMDKDAFAAAAYGIMDIQATEAACNAYQTESKGENKMAKSEARKKFEETVDQAEQIMKEELEQERIEAEIKQMVKEAHRLHNMYTAFITAGFTEEQAWKLLTMQSDIDISD